MTLPITGPITLTDVMNELRVVNPGRAYPIVLGDADVRALAGIASGPVSLTNLRGKSSYISMTITPTDGYGFGTSSTSGGIAICSPSISVTGGSGGYTYHWAFESNPSSCALSNATSLQCNVSHNYVKTANGSAGATLSCTVTDNTGHSVTRSGINALLEWAP